MNRCQLSLFFTSCYMLLFVAVFGKTVPCISPPLDVPCLFPEGCGSADRPADSEGRPGTLASAGEFPDPWGHVTTGSSTNVDLVRSK